MTPISARRHVAIALDAIAGRAKGLVAMTGCMGGVVAQAILEEGPRPAGGTRSRG